MIATENSLVTERVGDLLLTFGNPSTPLPVRSNIGNWTTRDVTSDWSLATNLDSASWRGFPCISHTSGGRRLLLLGELYGESDPQETLAQIVQRDRCPGSLNGHFLLLDWEPLTQQWHVWTDRFGTIHAYHSQGLGRGAISTYFPAVVAVESSRRIDKLGLRGFFEFGFFPQDRTYYEDVRIIEPASHYVFSADGKLVDRQRYWRWHYAPDPHLSYDDAVDEFAGIFESVMHDMLSGGPIAVPISGGLDSRTTAAVVPSESELSRRVWSYSYGYGKNSVETQIGRQIADSRGLSFRAFSIQPYLFESLERVLRCVEGFQDVTQCRQASVTPTIGEHAKFLIAAHWGDVWLDDAGLNGEPSRVIKRDNIAEQAWDKLTKRGSVWLQRHFCGGQTSDERLKDLRDAFRAQLSDYEHLEDADFRLKAFKTDSWSFRCTIASLRMFQSVVYPRIPFYDTRLADFFCRVPSRYVSDRQLQIDYLRRFAPDLASIRWEARDVDLFRLRRCDAARFSKRAVRKIWRTVTRERTIQRNWEVQFLSPDGRRELRRWLTRSGLRLHEYFAPVAINELLAAFDRDSTDPARGYALSMLLTFSAWLEIHA